MTNVLLVVAHQGYQPVEYGETKRILEQNGFHVVTASNKIGTASAKDGSSVPVEKTVAQTDADQYQAVIFIGGPGALDNLDNQDSYTLANQAIEANILLGAICISTRILAHAGVLKYIHATGWDGDGELSDIYGEYDVDYVNAPVVYDQGIITATGPDAATEFGNEIVRILKNS